MKRIMLIAAYDGTNYCGWQVQPNGRTIEGELNKALSKLLSEEIQVIGASRTDSGVHALGNVAVFDSSTRIPPEKIAYALNQRLPEDIRIQKSLETAPDFHPRHCESQKTYEYRILNRKIPIPTERFYSYFYYRDLNIEAMKDAAVYMTGRHDFKSFCSAGSQVKDTHRTIYSLSVDKQEDIITIRVTGNGFLYNMVRIIAGTLLNAGMELYKPEYMKDILEAKDRNMAGPKAPAHGLRLIKIDYINGH